METMPLARVLGVPRDAIEAARAIAGALLAHGERERARRIYAGCLALDPADRAAAIALAGIAIDLGDPGAALLALAGARGSIEVELLAARAELLAGALDGARERLRAIDDPRARALLARLERR